MITQRRATFLLVALAVLVVVLFGVSVLRQRPAGDNGAPVIRADDFSRGPSDARVTIVEFGDFQCSFCRDAADAMGVALAQTSVQVRHVWKDAPLAGHDQALAAAVAARCAGDQGKFWEFHDRLFAASTLTVDTFASLATDLQLDTARFTQCQADAETVARVRQSMSEAQALRVFDLPTFFINGRRVTGALTSASLRAIIEAEAAAVRQ